jgi:hypothetical protein
MLLNEILPTFDVTEVHSIEVRARPEIVFSAIKDVRLDEISCLVRLLLALRSVPERMVGRKGLTAPPARPLLSYMLDNGFVLLGEEQQREIAFGRMAPASIGRVWKPSSNVNVPLSGPEQFLAFHDPDYIKIAANLTMEPDDEGGFVVRTESRCLALSRQALREFLPYWRIIRPFSGLIRRLWLRGIRTHALSAEAGRA